MNRSMPTFSFLMMTLVSCSLLGCRSTLPAAPTTGLSPPSVQGRYEGYLPCADCPGIAYQLVLNADGTYTASSFYTDRSERPVIESGSYTVDGGTVVLDKEDAGMKYFSVQPRGLQMLDIHRKPISGAFSRQYILTRGTPSTDGMPGTRKVTLMEKKLAQGIDFYAVGNEPSWSVDIDFEKGMRFRSLTDVSELNTPPAREDKAQDADVTRYFAQTEAGTLIVTVSREECLDGMGGERFPYRVRVDVKRSADADYTEFEGCGRYVADSRLDNIWVMTRLGDRILQAEAFGRGLPELEFNLADNRVAGNSGCNQFTGGCEVRGDKIIFGHLATTRMACPNMAFENEFLSAITRRTLRYTINDGRLILTDDNDDQTFNIIFRKTD